MNIPPSSPSLPTVVADGDVVAEKARWRALVRAARRELVDAWGATGARRPRRRWPPPAWSWSARAPR
ncbi:hypothetical protein [Ornithinimicrobium sp. W1665]|uniref:hypothetical protein n=1 Tax=Ornithinimicrobium sp. W1665 TaxID=3416666 RepID=UPI003D6A01EE